MRKHRMWWEQKQGGRVRAEQWEYNVPEVTGGKFHTREDPPLNWEQGQLKAGPRDLLLLYGGGKTKSVFLWLVYKCMQGLHSWCLVLTIYYYQRLIDKWAQIILSQWCSPGPNLAKNSTNGHQELWQLTRREETRLRRWPGMACLACSYLAVVLTWRKVSHRNGYKLSW